MSRRVRRKGAQSKDKEKGISRSYCEDNVEGTSRLEKRVDVDWTNLPDDTVIQLFASLNYRDRASLSSTCRQWRLLGSSPCLWTSLDLRAHKCDPTTASSLASRCTNLQKLRFRGSDSANSIINLHARDLREISGDYCRDITDASLSVMVARHEFLESLQIGPDFCERITSDAIKVIALCCVRLKRLRLSGIRDVDGDAINALAKHCTQLVEVGFVDCGCIDEASLGNLLSIRFISVSGTRNMKWSLVSQNLTKLPNLIGADFSRTDITLSAVSSLLSLSQSLKVLCALNCSVLEAEGNYAACNVKGKVFLSLFADIFKGLCSLFADITIKERNVFLDWRNSKKVDRNRNEIMSWLEWILSHSLLRIAETNLPGLDGFWLRQGTALLLSLIHSSQEDVQERAATGLATFVVIDDENATVDCERAEAVMRDGGICLLLDLASSCREGLQSEAAKAIANLSVNAKVAKAVAEEGGITILANLARSMNRLVAEEAAGGLWNLSVGEEHKGAIAEAGGVKALVDLIFKWPLGGDGVLERAAGALANLAADDKCSMEVAAAGGVHALVMLARTVTEAYGGLAVLPNSSRRARFGAVISLRLLCGCSSGLWNYLVSYVVRDGDTVGSLASRFGVSMDSIEEVNGISNPDNVTVGDVYYIPMNSVPGEPYTINKEISPVPAPAPMSSVITYSVNHKHHNTHFPYGWIIGSLGVGLILIVLTIFICISFKSLNCCAKIPESRVKDHDRKISHKFHILQRTSFCCASGRYLCCKSGNWKPTTGNSSDRQINIPKAIATDVFDMDKPIIFIYEEIYSSTDGFSDSSLLGHGTYGSVYYAVLRDQEVAIKRMTATKTKEFMAEMKVLCKVHHTNLVELIGYAASDDELFLIYEYANKGSLKSHLHDPQNKGHTSLSWITRVQIALDAARGLEYIHEHTKEHYVHRDIKTSNILLDNALRAKISDFGLAKLVGKISEGEASTTKVVGTLGYLAPEYLSDGLATTKSDVYAYGIVLFELISGKEAITRTEGVVLKNPERRSLGSIMLAALRNSPSSINMESLKECIDPNLMDLYPSDCVYKMAMLAKQCIDEDPILRPDMKQVVISLSQILLSSVEWEATLAGNSQVFSGLVQGR